MIHGERAGVDYYLGSKKRKVFVEAAAFSSQVTSFFKNIGSDSALALAAKEATFAYHIATHGQSFRSSDCTFKLVSKQFEPKLSLGKTKWKAIVKVIPQMFTDELHQKLNQINFVTVKIDASNMQEVKLVLIVVCYFLPESGVKVKLLEFKSVSGETAGILSKYFLSVLNQTKLKNKLIQFCTHN